MINPLRWALNTVSPSFKNDEPEYPVGTTRILELTYSDGTKNYIPEIYEKESCWLPPFGEFIEYSWQFHFAAVFNSEYFTISPYDLDDQIKSFYDGGVIITEEFARKIIEKFPKERTIVKREPHIIDQ